MGEGVNGRVKAIAVSGSDIYVGGYFDKAGSLVVNNIAKWDGSVWSALGTGTSGEVLSIVALGTNIYTGGAFTYPANRIARWNGSSLEQSWDRG